LISPPETPHNISIKKIREVDLPGKGVDIDLVVWSTLRSSAVSSAPVYWGAVDTTSRSRAAPVHRSSCA
jgi:hypothetical protein